MTPLPLPQARALARRAYRGLSRIVWFVVVVELIAASVRAIAEPDPTPVALTHVAVAARVGYAFLAILAARRLLSLARAIAHAGYVAVALTCYALAALLAVVPLLDVVPDRVAEATWDTALQLFFAVLFTAGTALSLLVARTVAEREERPALARSLQGGLLPLVVTAALAVFAIDPALAPAGWLPPALALALPPVMLAFGLVRWEIALWLLLTPLAIGATLMHESDGMLGPLVLAALSLGTGLAATALALRPALNELATALARPIESPAGPPDLAPPAAVELLPHAMSRLERGLAWCFAALLARILILVFGYIWSASPLAEIPLVVAFFCVALATSSGLMVRGLLLVGSAPAPAIVGPARAALGASTLLLLADLALGPVHLVAPTTTWLTITDAGLAVVAVAALTATLGRVGEATISPRLSRRARGLLLVLTTWTALATGTVLLDGFRASDLQWLSLPLGLTTALVGLGLWVALLWLIHDARDALRTSNAAR